MASGFDAWALLSKLGPAAYAWGEKLVRQRSQKALQDSRDQLAMEVGTQIVRMILSGKSMRDADLLNLEAELNGLVQKGAKLPRDQATTVMAMIERAKIATGGTRGGRWESWPTRDSAADLAHVPRAPEQRRSAPKKALVKGSKKAAVSGTKNAAKKVTARKVATRAKPPAAAKKKAVAKKEAIHRRARAAPPP